MKFNATTLRALSIFLILTFYSAIESNAQISITQPTFEQFHLQAEYDITQYISEESADISALINQSGPDQAWDFTTLNFENESMSASYTMMDDPGGAPGGNAAEFGDATHVGVFLIDEMDFEEDQPFEILELYSFFQLEDNEARTLGQVMIAEDEQGGEQTNHVYYTPGQVDFIFPVEYEDSWQYEYEEENVIFGQPFTAEYEAEVEVDGWGELITPEGSEDVLRYKKTMIRDGASEDVQYEFIKADGQVVAIISGEGEDLQAVFNSYSHEPTSTEVEKELAETINLEQNYPNPFNPVTQINYEITEPGEVSLKVYTVLGEPVATLVSQYQGAGSHMATFDAEHLTSGVYMYRLAVNGQVMTRRMTLVK